MSTSVEKFLGVLLLIVCAWSITLMFMNYRVVKERNAIVGAHCDVLDASTKVFKCANGKVYLLGVSE